MKLACRFGLCLTALVWVCAEPAQADAVKLSGCSPVEKCTASRWRRAISVPAPGVRQGVHRQGERRRLHQRATEGITDGQELPIYSRRISVITSRSPEKLIRPPRRFRSRQSRGSNMKEPHARGRT